MKVGGEVGGALAVGVGVTPTTVDPPPSEKIVVGSPPRFSHATSTKAATAAKLIKQNRVLFRSKNGPLEIIEKCDHRYHNNSRQNKRSDKHHLIELVIAFQVHEVHNYQREFRDAEAD